MTIKNLSAMVTINGAISGAFRHAFSTASQSLARLGEKTQNLERQHRTLGKAIQTFGRMGKDVDKLRGKYQSVTSELNKMRVATERLSGVEKARQANLSKQADLRGKMLGAVALGATMAAPIVMAAKFEGAMLGVAKQLDGARDKTGKLTAAYEDMRKKIIESGKSLPLPYAQIAGMNANALRQGIDKDQAGGFVRSVSEMATAFDMEDQADSLADTMGQIANMYKIPIPNIKKFGDAVNYLDDNCTSTSEGILSFVKSVAGSASLVKTTEKEMAALGSTFLSLGETEERAATATNVMFQRLASAEKGTGKLKRAMKELGLNLKDVQQGMQVDGMGTVLNVIDRIRQLPKEKQSGVLAELFGQEHYGKIAKLVNDVDELRRQLALAHSEEAKGSVGREFAARLASTQAQFALTQNSVSRLAIDLGTVLLPSVNMVLGGVTGLTGGLAGLAERFPRATQVVMGLTVGLVGLRIAALATGYAWTLLKGGVLTSVGLFYRFSAAADGAEKGAAAATRGPTWLGKTFKWLGRAAWSSAKLVSRAAWLMGKSIFKAGRMMLASPITWVVAGIAGAAYLIYTNWEPISAWFKGLWEGIGNVFSGAWEWIKTSLKFTPLGLLMTYWGPITGWFNGLWDKVTDTVSGAYRRLTDYMGWDPLSLIKGIWQPISDFFSDLWKGISDTVGGAIERISNKISGVGSAWQKVSSLSGGPKLVTPGVENQTTAQLMLAPMSLMGQPTQMQQAKQPPSSSVQSKGKNLPSNQLSKVVIAAEREQAMPAAIARVKAKPKVTVTDNSQITIHIVQQPRENAEQLARRIGEILKREKATLGRSSMVDGVFA